MAVSGLIKGARKAIDAVGDVSPTLKPNVPQKATQSVSAPVSQVPEQAVAPQDVATAKAFFEQQGIDPSGFGDKDLVDAFDMADTGLLKTDEAVAFLQKGAQAASGNLVMPGDIEKALKFFNDQGIDVGNIKGNDLVEAFDLAETKILSPQQAIISVNNKPTFFSADDVTPSSSAVVDDVLTGSPGASTDINTQKKALEAFGVEPQAVETLEPEDIGEIFTAPDEDFDRVLNLNIANRSEGFEVDLGAVFATDKQLNNTVRNVDQDLPVLQTIVAVRGLFPNSRVGQAKELAERVLTNTTPDASNVEVSFAIQDLTKDLGEEGVKEYAQALEQLAPIDLGVMNFYTKRGDLAMNYGLRNDRVTEGSNLDKTIQRLNSALDRLPPYEGPAFRRMSADQISRYQIGEVIEEKAFTSFSTRPIDPKDPNDPKFQTVMIVESKSAKHIEPVSSFQDEREVLYRTNTKFRVIDIDEDRNEVFVEEVIE